MTKFWGKNEMPPIGVFQMPPIGVFREVEKMEIWYRRNDFTANLGDATKTWEAQFRNTINICTKYGFYIYG